MKRLDTLSGSHPRGTAGLARRRILASGALFGALVAPAPLLAQQGGAEPDRRLDTVVVRGVKQTEVEQARTRLDEVAGSTSVVDSEALSRGRNSTLGDVLAYQPGVLVQSVGGNDAVRISIRGSGMINSPGYFREGIKFLYDGVALTGTGGTTYELLNASGVGHTEILRGGNAFDHGALALGGAVNFVTHTGYSAPGQRIRYETGSWGLHKVVLSSGGVAGDFDYFVNVDNYRSEGYRSDHSLSKSSGSVINLGYRFSPKLTTRLLIRYRDEYHEDPGPLTFPEFERNASSASPVAQASRNSGRRKGTVWVAGKASYSFDDGGQLEFGLGYHEYPHANSKDNPIGNPGFWDWHDLNASLRYARTDFLAGHESRTSLSFTSTQHLVGQVTTIRGSNRAEVLNRKYFRDSHDRTFSLGNDLQLSDGLWLSTGLAAVNVRRKIDIAYSNQTATPGSTDYDNWSLAPRIGVRYDLAAQLQAFANFTRSIDPPVDWRYANARDQITPLTEQKANTLEAGIRGRVGIVDGSLAVYRSWIRDELLTVVDEAETARQGGTVVTASFNSSTPTLHQGVELSLDARLWEGASGDQVVLRQVYTYNDFRYRDDPRQGDNQLPGIPAHVYQAKLEYQHRSGLYAGLNLQSFSRTAVDYANTLHAPSYTLFGATAGYEAPDGQWQAFLDLKNLTDKDHVVTVLASYDAGGNRDTRAFFPGDGFGVFAGAEYRF